MKSAISVFDYQDYRTYLEAEYAWQKANNPKFSLRYFALRAKTRSYTTLKYVIEKRRHLSHLLLDQFSAALELDQEEAEYFQLLWKYGTAQSHHQETSLRARIDQILADRGNRSAKLLENLKQAKILYEKCQFEDARAEYKNTYELARKYRQISMSFEALAGLIRIAHDLGKAEELVEIENLVNETQSLVVGEKTPAAYFYCRAKLAQSRDDFITAQKHFLSLLRSARDPLNVHKELEARAWISLAYVQCEKGHWKQAEFICHALLKKYSDSVLQGVKGYILIYLGLVMEKKGDSLLAQLYYEQAHSKFREEQNWYCCLYSLFSYARVARLKGDYVRSEAYLEIARKSVPIEFKALSTVLEREKKELHEGETDLFFDPAKRLLKLKHLGEVSIGNQYILLKLLETLCQAHLQSSSGELAGVSKAQLIEKVWRVPYRPSLHDNKLYYNINRIRKLIEPDPRRPSILIGWRDGYRLAPELKVRFCSQR